MPQLAKCFRGARMGWGSPPISGANDGLVPVGMPLLWPCAWVARLTMCAAVEAALPIEKAAARSIFRREDA